VIPFVIDNDQHRLSDVLNTLLAESSGTPLDLVHVPAWEADGARDSL
jgi:hypothetical protein